MHIIPFQKTGKVMNSQIQTTFFINAISNPEAKKKQLQSLQVRVWICGLSDFLVSILVQNIPRQKQRSGNQILGTCQVPGALCLPQNININVSELWVQTERGDGALRQGSVSWGRHQGGVRAPRSQSHCDQLRLGGSDLPACNLYKTSNNLVTQQCPVSTGETPLNSRLLLLLLLLQSWSEENSFESSFCSWSTVKYRGASWYRMFHDCHLWSRAMSEFIIWLLNFSELPFSNQFQSCRFGMSVLLDIN